MGGNTARPRRSSLHVVLDPALRGGRTGRAAEFAKFAWAGGVPDPGAPATFLRSRLNHALATAPRHRELREFYRRWLAVRAQHPALGARHKERTRVALDGDVLTLSRSEPGGAGVTLVANLSGERRPIPAISGRSLIDSADPRFGGASGTSPLAPYHSILFER